VANHYFRAYTGWWSDRDGHFSNRIGYRLADTLHFKAIFPQSLERRRR
jgi:hypothetical protein